MILNLLFLSPCVKTVAPVQRAAWQQEDTKGEAECRNKKVEYRNVPPRDMCEPPREGSNSHSLIKQ